MQYRSSKRAALYAAALAIFLNACGGGHPAAGNDAGSGGVPADGEPGAPVVANSVTAAVDPAGTMTVNVNARQAVQVTFASSDGKPATNLHVTSDLTALPAGWSSGSPSFACASVTSGNACQLGLTYAPTAAAADTLSLSYQYVDSAGAARTGSVGIAYEAKAVALANAYILDQSVTHCAVGADGALSACQVAVAPLTGSPSSLAISGSTAYITNSSAGNLTACTIAADGSFSSCADAGLPALDGPQSVVVDGARLYVADSNNRKVVKCAINADGSLSGCADAGAMLSNTILTMAVKGRYLYAAVSGGNIDRCDIASDGALSSCTNAGASSYGGPYGMVAIDARLYILSNWDDKVYQCAIGADGSLAACGEAGPTALSGLSGAQGIGANGSYVYVTNGMGNTVTQCAVAVDGSLAPCKNSGATSVGSPITIVFK